MRLLRGVLPGVCVVILAFLASAAPFDRWIEFTQPGGAVVRIHGSGDEFSARFETAEGYTVVFDKALRAYCYARQDTTSGGLVSTGVPAHEPAPADLQPGVRMSVSARQAMIAERYETWEAGMQTRPRWEALKQTARLHYTPRDPNGPQYEPPPFETVGLKVGLTMLIDFSDVAGTIPQAEVVNFLNGDNYTGFGNNGSVKEYFYDNSGGLLTYTNVATIYVRAPQPKSFYADVTKDAGSQGNLLIKDCLEVLKGLPNYQTEILPLFDALTTDAQNRVVAFNVYYAGDDGGVWAAGLWPHSWVLAEVGEQELSPGGKKLWFYQLTNIGNQLSIATFCHENGHMLCGYPDIYDYEYDSTGGAGVFCLMNSGGFGQNPSQICAYLKRASGWATVTEVTTATTMKATLSSAGTNFNHFYRFQKPGVPTEYYLIENRQATGRDAILPSSGIAVWHCDELGDRDNQSLAYNTSHANYEVTLMQADNRWDFQNNRNDGDLADLWFEGNPASGYPGEFTDDSQPSARWWDGSRSGLIMSEISVSGTDMTVQLGFGMSLRTGLVSVGGGNGNGVIDPNECNQLTVELYNSSGLAVTGIKTRLSSSTPGVIIAQRNSNYQDLQGGETNVNLTPFQVSTAPWFICGTPIDFTLSFQSDQGAGATQFQLPTGMPTAPQVFSNNVVMPIPDGFPGGMDSTITVSNLSGAIQKLAVSLHIAHTWVGDLTLQLISPNGITNTLSQAHGSSGDNYGLSCQGRTIFDDDAVDSIGSANAPFLGLFSPDEPLAMFNGLSGTDLNGTWTLRVSDSTLSDFGTLRCWSLHFTVPECQDGNGECPGSDLAATVSAAPNPVILGQSLTYTIHITNQGPSTAKSVILSQVLPASVTVNSVQCSQGAGSSAGGVVTCNLGAMGALSHASVVVRVTPLIEGIAMSSISVSSEQLDFNQSDNTVTVETQVNPPTADIAIGLNAVPSSVVVGETVALTLSVTNKGPSSASAIFVTNMLPQGLSLSSSSISQGSISTSGSNIVVCAFGGLSSSARASAVLHLTATSAGQLSVSSRAVANYFDPISGNNAAAALIAVGPSADLAVGIVDMPDPVLENTRFTWTATVTNRGLSDASGVILTIGHPPGLNILSNWSSRGTVTLSAGGASCAIGEMSKGAVEMVVLTMESQAGVISGSASVAGAETDLNTANNVANVSTTVAEPFAEVVAAGATLILEGIPNGAFDAGETNDVVLRLRNVGNIPTTDLVATLQSSGGITPVGPTEQHYGVLAPSGWPVGKAFKFVASGANGGTAVATLELRDGSSTNLATFTFTLPNVHEFSNTNQISINDNSIATPYPSTIHVTGVDGIVGKVAVTVSNFTHTFPKDVNMMVGGPLGNASMIMSRVGKKSPAPVTLTFDDSAPSALTTMTQLASGLWKPSANDSGVVMPAPAPPSYDPTLSTFNNRNPNGTWSLFVADENSGDFGVIQQGWSLKVVTITPVNQVADLTIAGIASPSPVIAGETLTCSFTVTNAGPDTANAVMLTNTIPAAFVSAACSQGSVAVLGGNMVADLGSIPAGSTATVTLVVRPGATAGNIVCTAGVAANETDLNLVQNTTSISVPVNLPAADVAIAHAAAPSTVLEGQSIALTLNVVNNGPATSLGTVVSNQVPAGMTFVSASSTRGSAALYGNVVVCQLGDLASGDEAGVTVTFQAASVGAGMNVASVSTLSQDADLSDNSSSVELMVEAAAPDLRIYAMRLLNESISANGTVDNGETVTLMIVLTNAGTLGAGWVTAVLEPVQGMTLDGGTNQLHQFYHGIHIGRVSEPRPFVFTASGAPGELVQGKLTIWNGNEIQSVWPLEFAIPSSATFANASALQIPENGPSMPYPSIIEVTNARGYVNRATVSLNGITHSFPRDLNVLLVAPNGTSVLLMSGAGGERALTNVNLAFADNAAALPEDAQIASGTWSPTSFGEVTSLPSPAPGTPYNATLSKLLGCPANGTWSLYVYDETPGDSGMIAGGWNLSLELLDMVNPLADLALTLSTSPAVAGTGATFTNRIVIMNHGPGAADYIFVTNSLPQGAQFVRATASIGSVNTSTALWEVGSLANAAMAVCDVEFTMPAPGQFTSSSLVTSWATEFELANNQATAPLTVTVSVPPTLAATVEQGVCKLLVSGQQGTECVVEWSSDLQSWTPMATNTIPSSGELKVTDPEPATKQSRFYRVR